MLTIPPGQMSLLDEQANQDLCERLMVRLRQQFADRIPPDDAALRRTIQQWMQDARVWGFNSDEAVTNYVTFCARQFGTRDPLEERLEVYLRINQESLVQGVDLKAFCPAVLLFARQHDVQADEGVAWLASIVLAGLAKGDRQLNWIALILDQPALAEETRMHAVHKQAIARGWIAAGTV